MYKLDNHFAQGTFTVTVVGCGGTGGFVAEGLCRLLPSRATLMLVDPDRVVERNLGRQNFSLADLGHFKSQVLAETLAVKSERPVAYSVLPISLLDSHGPGIVIGCVDNGPARRDIALKVADNPWHSWWVDAGNGENYGQVLIGNVKDRLYGTFDIEKQICLALPLPTMQRPDILSQQAPVRSCAEAVQAEEQSPTINQIMASWVLEVVRRLIEGSLTWIQVYIDVEVGMVNPVWATPETVAKITGIPFKKLIRKEANRG